MPSTPSEQNRPERIDSAAYRYSSSEQAATAGTESHASSRAMSATTNCAAPSVSSTVATTSHSPYGLLCFLPPVRMKSRFRVSDEPEYVGRCETIYSNPYDAGPSALRTIVTSAGLDVRVCTG